MADFVADTEAAIALWHGITPPNPAAHRFTEDLRLVIGAFEALRESLGFEEEPSAFEAALREAKR